MHVLVYLILFDKAGIEEANDKADLADKKIPEELVSSGKINY